MCEELLQHSLISLCDILLTFPVTNWRNEIHFFYWCNNIDVVTMQLSDFSQFHRETESRPKSNKLRKMRAYLYMYISMRRKLFHLFKIKFLFQFAEENPCGECLAGIFFYYLLLGDLRKHKSSILLLWYLLSFKKKR